MQYVTYFTEFDALQHNLYISYLLKGNKQLLQLCHKYSILYSTFLYFCMWSLQISYNQTIYVLQQHTEATSIGAHKLKTQIDR